jgi:hypothetical protein
MYYFIVNKIYYEIYKIYSKMNSEMNLNIGIELELIVQLPNSIDSTQVHSTTDKSMYHIKEE